MQYNPDSDGEATPITSSSGVVSLVEGGTFCLSDGTGDIRPNSPYGLFFRDTRLISRWELRLDGQAGQPLSVTTPEAFAARFVLRRPPTPGEWVSTLLLVRERLVGDGLQETVTLHNLGREAISVTLALAAGGG